MNVCVERGLLMIGLLLLVWALIASGFQWALWAVRTGRVDLAKLNRKLGGGHIDG